MKSWSPNENPEISSEISGFRNLVRFFGVLQTPQFTVTDFLNENERTFTKLFVANPWIDIDSDPVDPIPSPISYLYTTDDILDQINFLSNSVSFMHWLGKLRKIQHVTIML